MRCAQHVRTECKNDYFFAYIKQHTFKFTTRDKPKHHETVSQKRANLSLSTSSNAGKSLSSWLYDAQNCHIIQYHIINHDTPPNQAGRGTSERRRAHTGKGRTRGRPGVKRQGKYSVEI